jgi:hypothetical protein
VRCVATVRSLSPDRGSHATRAERNSLKEADRALRAGGEQKIAHEMQAIDRCNTISLFDSNEVQQLKFQQRRRKPLLGVYYLACPPMVSKIIAVSVLGFCAVVTVAWTTFLGWGLYELLH